MQNARLLRLPSWTQGRTYTTKDTSVT